MPLSEEEMLLLKALRNFLSQTFKGSSFGSFKMDDGISILDKVIGSHSSQVEATLVLDSMGRHETHGKPVFIVANPTKCNDFDHITGHCVKIDGENYTAIAVEKYAHCPPWREGEKIGIQVEPKS